MFENLNQSYPFNNNFKHNAKTIGLVGMAFVLIVLYFQPFGINFLKSEHDGYFVLAAGVLCAGTLFSNAVIVPGLLPSVFDTAKWTIRKEMIWNIWLFSNLFVIILLLVWLLRKNEFIDLPLFRTGALALLPLVLFNLINYNLSLKSKVVSVFDTGRQWFKEEQKKHENIPELKLTAENGKDVFTAPQNDVILIHSSGNYIEIYWKERQVIRKTLFRQTFTFVEKFLNESSDFKKCHRCWLVNLKKADRLTRNTKGHFLGIDSLDFNIPVSRNYINYIRDEFSQLNKRVQLT
jgi:hypothetical protein